MKNISLYSGRFIVIEAVAYFILLVPWIPSLLRGNLLPENPSDLAVKIILTAAVVLFIALLRDVRQKISSLDKLKQGLAMAAIHDLKGPLTSIIGALSIIAEPDMDPVTRDKLLKVAAQDSRSMIRLIQTLVDTERMEIAKMLLHPQQLDLRSHLKECVDIFTALSADLGIELNMNVENGLPPIYADKDLLGRVYQNLIMNAFKYCRGGCEITVSARFSEGWFRFEFKDTGMGISPEYIEKVFEKYYRMEGHERDSRKGSGLGLYFCRLAVEAHGGKIRVESKKDQWTSILFDIPQAWKDAPAAGREPA